MKIKIFNATQKEISNKKYNVFIGISIGVKPLNKELAKKYLNWALKNTKEKVAILIADEMSKINYKVFSGYGDKKSLKRALRGGEKYVSFFKEVLSEIPENEREKIVILRWKDVFKERLNEIKKILEYEFKNNKKFREQIFYFLKKYVERRRKKLGDEQLEYLSEYILLELPTLLYGIEFKEIKYKLLFYPTFIKSGMSKFVIDIENGKIFPELRDKLGLTEKTVLVESYINED